MEKEIELLKAEIESLKREIAEIKEMGVYVNISTASCNYQYFAQLGKYEIKKPMFQGHECI